MVAPQEGDASGTIRSVTDGHALTLPRASAIRFSYDGRFTLATLAPAFDEARKARRDSVPAAAQPKASLTIVELDSGKTDTIERVASFSLPVEDSGWFAYRLEPPKPVAPVKPEAKPEADSETRK